MTNLKKYTNADFYKNGVFQQEIAIEAMKEMFVHYNIPFTGFMAENMWVTDFGLETLKMWVWRYLLGE